MTRDRTALGAFLRSRRDGLTPARAGITAFPGARRVPGLRKEELAVLAGLSPDYYSRLEQGRQASISEEVLDSLARALRLDPVEHAHLHDLAAPGSRRRTTAPRPPGSPGSPGAPGSSGSPGAPQRADPGLLRLMQTLSHVPVLLLGHRGDVLAANALLGEVLGRPLEPGSSFFRYLFLDPSSRERIVNWADFASSSVGALRREAGRHPQDRRLRALIDDLRGSDPDVARWWDDHGVRDYASVAKQIAHPRAGTLLFDIEIVSAPQEPDQRLVVYTAQPDSPTARILPLLASWATPARTPCPPTHTMP